MKTLGLFTIWVTLLLPLAAEATVHDVSITNFDFSPMQVTVQVGDTVKWTNNNPPYAHTATASDGEFNSGNMNPGATYQHQFDTEGEYDYICSYHPTMDGIITVEAGETPEPQWVVQIVDFAFIPQELSIAVGDTVRWTNMDGVAHTATASGGEFNSGTLSPGDFYDHIFMTAGNFDYVCSFHDNMNGVIHVVGEPEPDFVINITDDAFDPAQLEVDVGAWIRWVNVGDNDHQVYETGDAFDSGLLAPGETFDHTFDTQGEYVYIDLIDPALVGVILVDTQHGANPDWSELNSPADLPLNDIRFWDAETGWAGGEEGIFYTGDGGDNWDLYDTDDDVEAVHFISATEGWACGNDGLILHTINGGAFWENLNSAVNEKLRDIWFVDAMNGWAIGRDGILIHSSNGGLNWSPQSSPATDDLRGIHMHDTQTGWICGSDGLVLKTVNGGLNWTTSLSAPDGEADAFEAIFALDADHVWTVGESGRIYSTTNGGDDWDEEDCGTTVTLNDVFFTSMEEGWVCGAGGFLSMSMGMGMWHTQIQPAFQSFNAIWFVAENLGYLAAGDGSIYKYEVESSSVGEPNSVVADRLELLPAYPNPFNPTTTLSLVNPQAQQVQLTIYDLLGREVATLYNDNLSAGRHEFTFDASRLASGLYVAQVEADGFTSSRKLTFAK